MTYVKRDGPFIRIDLPPPGRFVIVVAPNTAAHLATVIRNHERGRHVICGRVIVTIDVHNIIAKELTYHVQFDEWPGTLVMNEWQMWRFAHSIKSEISVRRDVCVPSSCVENQLRVNNPALKGGACRKASPMLTRSSNRG